MNFKEAKAAHSDALAAYRAIENTGTQAELRAASDTVKAAMKAMSDAITVGAKPCPICEAAPHGLEHPTQRGGFEFEVGCIVCPPFEHTDGTRRNVAARGGILPRHAVEAWNEGPDYWAKAKPEPKRDE